MVKTTLAALHFKKIVFQMFMVKYMRYVFHPSLHSFTTSPLLFLQGLTSAGKTKQEYRNPTALNIVLKFTKCTS